MKRTIKSRLLVCAVLATAFSTPMVGAADNARCSDPSQMNLWQGRAGGLIHSDRIAHLRLPNTGTEVAIAYDEDVAQRTNMLRGDVEASNLAVTYDKEVAKRTNMPRDDRDTQTAQAAAQE